MRWFSRYFGEHCTAQFWRRNSEPGVNWYLSIIARLQIYLCYQVSSRSARKLTFEGRRLERIAASASRIFCHPHSTQYLCVCFHGSGTGSHCICRELILFVYSVVYQTSDVAAQRRRRKPLSRVKIHILISNYWRCPRYKILSSKWGGHSSLYTVIVGGAGLVI